MKEDPRPRSAPVLALLCTLFALALPPLAAPASPGIVVYLTESNDDRVAVFSLDEEDGGLERIGELELEGRPGPLALSADGRHLYAGVRAKREFATLAIDRETGLLSHVSSAPAAGSAPYVFAEPSGRWLLAAYYGEGLVSVSALRDGEVAGEPVTVLETGRKAHCVRTDPSNRFAFVPHTGELNKVEQLRFDPETGALVPNDPPHLPGGEGHGPRHLKFHPNGRWVYQVNEQGKSVTLCDFDTETGTLTMRQTLSTVPPEWDPDEGSCAEILLSSDGRFVYASNRGHDSIAIFAVDAEDGSLTSLGRVPTEQTPRSFAIMPRGEEFVIVAGQGADRLAVYRRDPEIGALALLGTYETGQSPTWVMGVDLTVE